MEDNVTSVHDVNERFVFASLVLLSESGKRPHLQRIQAGKSQK